MVKLLRTLTRRAGSLVGKGKGQRKAGKWAKRSLDSRADHHGLPQELIDQIIDILRDDIQTLKACSLTCRAMFASTRHLIHQTLRLTSRNNQSVLTRTEKFRQQKLDHNDIGLRLLSCMRERNLLQYPQQVYISMSRGFTPDNLLPYLHEFQSLDQVHSLTIENYDAIPWADHYKTCFVHFYPTLTSLTLSHPLNHYRLLLQFSLQFPNLQDLSIELLEIEERTRANLMVPSVVDQSPPLRGHLRLAGVDTVVQWPVDLDHELPNGINFRSVELEDFFGSRAQHMLNACANTLEDLTIVPYETGYLQLHNLKFNQIPNLGRVTLRMEFAQVSALALELLPRAVSTITSHVFHEFVLELGRLPSNFTGRASMYWGNWDRIDRFLGNQFANREDFKLVIRTGQINDQGTFQKHAKETFSFLASRGCVHFETAESIERYWS